jgi:protein CpxP
MRTQRLGLGIGIVALAIALAGPHYSDLNAQGSGSGGGQFGGPGRGQGGPGGPGRRGGPGGPGALGPMMLERLNLSQAQRDSVRAIMDSHREEQMGIGQKARAAHEALDAAIAADTLDEGLVRTRAADLAFIDSDAAVLRARVYQEVLQVLTAEQRTTLKELQAKMKERQAEMERRRAEGPPPQQQR